VTPAPTAPGSRSAPPAPARPASRSGRCRPARRRAAGTPPDERQPPARAPRPHQSARAPAPSGAAAPAAAVVAAPPGVHVSLQPHEQPAPHRHRVGRSGTRPSSRVATADCSTVSNPCSSAANPSGSSASVDASSSSRSALAPEQRSSSPICGRHGQGLALTQIGGRDLQQVAQQSGVDPADPGRRLLQPLLNGVQRSPALPLPPRRLALIHAPRVSPTTDRTPAGQEHSPSEPAAQPAST
jgi:hypothetical protein